MKKIFDLEKRTINIIKNNYIIIGFIIISTLSLWLRIAELNFESNDYIHFLQPWFSHFKLNGGLSAISTYKGNYNAPYVTIIALLTYLPINSLYSIKFISIIFDYVLALSSVCLVRQLVTKNKLEYSLLTYTVILFLPQVFINSGLWAQCDSAYTSFVILGLLFLLKEKYIKSFIFLGIAFSLKLQALFILPLFIVIYISKNNFSILNFLLIPIVDFIMCLPAIIFGMPLKKLFTIYLGQTKTYQHGLSQNIPNLYKIVNGPSRILLPVGLIITLVVCIIILGYVIYKNIKWNKEKIINLALWFIVVVTYLLPGMHDRYIFVGEIIAVISLIVYKKNLPITITLIINSLIVYSIYLFKLKTINTSILSIVYLIVIIYYTKDMIKLLSK